MDNPIGPAHGFEQIAGLTQIDLPADAKFFPRRDPIETKHAIFPIDQIANNELTQPATATGHDDYFHRSQFTG
jgi:hypothetical protein